MLFKIWTLEIVYNFFYFSSCFINNSEICIFFITKLSASLSYLPTSFVVGKKPHFSKYPFTIDNSIIIFGHINHQNQKFLQCTINMIYPICSYEFDSSFIKSSNKFSCLLERNWSKSHENSRSRRDAGSLRPYVTCTGQVRLLRTRVI